MRRASFLFLILLMFAQLTFAQTNPRKQDAAGRGNRTVQSSNNPEGGVMSDDEILEYIKNEQAKGTDSKQIVMNLLKKGVTEAQLNRLRKEYLDKKKEKAGKTKTKSDETEFESRQREQQPIVQDFGLFTDSLDVLIPDSVALEELHRKMNERPKIFGHNIFRDKALNFEPNMNMATPEDYKLGPGDEVIIDVWGASQSTVIDEITPDGYLNIDILGLVYLSGMTVKEADSYLKEQYSRIYAGISGENPNARIKLSLGKIRTIQVSIMGEVENPGTYALSAFASVFHALYQAGGVNEIGTLRAIKVARGGKTVATIDIYDYLLNGKTANDIRLSDGDAIIVDTYDCLVDVQGKVKRPMFYEMKNSESAADLLRYAGGFAREAYRGDIRIERVGERERQIFTLTDSEQKTFKMRDGDIMSVDSVADSYENLVEVKGALYRPGKFQLGGSITTVKQLIERAGGLKPDAFVARALLNRRLPDLTMENLSVDVAGIMAGTAADIELRNNDVLYIPSLAEMEEIKVINIYGEVAMPGKYRYAENTTIEDVILMAGGLKDKASTARVEVVRRMRDSGALTSNDTIAKTFTFSIDKGLLVSRGNKFTLMPYDAVYVRRSPGYYEQQNVEIAGEVAFAGTYVLDRKNMRLSDLVKSAGGLSDRAYPKGARLERRMTAEEKARALQTLRTVQRQMDSIDIGKIEVLDVHTVGIELDKAMNNPGSDFDVVLQDGDKLIIPQFSNTVKISGNVVYPNTVTYKENKSLKYYIEQAGGYGQNAKKSKAIIIYKNGTVARAKGSKSSLIQPGCEIIVPTKVKRQGMSTTEILSLSSTSASLATVIIALINLLK